MAQITAIGRRTSGGGSTASDGWLYFYFDEPILLGSQYRVTSVYARFYKIRSASGEFTGDCPVRVDTSGGKYEIGKIKGYTFPASTVTNGTTISGYLNTDESVKNALASVSIERIDLGQSDYAGGKDIRCLESSTAEFILDYELRYSRCTAPQTVTVEKSVTATATNQLSWSGASGGTNNAISGYFIQYADSTDNVNWSAWKELKTVGVVSGTEVTMPANNTYRKYKVWTLGAAGSDWRSSTGTESGSTYRGHAALDGFTDSPLVAGETYVKALHMKELQDRANALRSFYGLSAYGFSTITSGTTGLKDWTAHVNEIRRAVDEISTNHAAWIAIPVNCPRADVIEQLRAVILAM